MYFGMGDPRGRQVCDSIPVQVWYPFLLCLLNETVRKDSVRYAQSAMDNALLVGSPSVSPCPEMVPWDEDATKEWKQLRQSLTAVHELNRTRGLTLLNEPAHGFESNHIWAVEGAVQMTNGLCAEDSGVLIDTAHCHVNAERLGEVIDSCEEPPIHIHMNDNSGEYDSRRIPGDSAVDLSELARARCSIFTPSSDLKVRKCTDVKEPAPAHLTK